MGYSSFMLRNSIFMVLAVEGLTLVHASLNTLNSLNLEHLNTPTACGVHSVAASLPASRLGVEVWGFFQRFHAGLSERYVKKYTNLPRI